MTSTFLIVIKLWMKIKRVIFVSNGNLERSFLNLSSSQLQVNSLSSVSKEFTFSFLNPITGKVEGKFFPPIEIATVKDCLVDLRSGMVSPRYGTILSESTPWPDEYVLLNRVPLKSLPRQVFNETRTYGHVVTLPSDGYYHWLIEGLPAFFRVLDQYPNIHVLCEASHPKYVDDLIDQFNIKVELENRFVRCSQITLATQGKQASWPRQSEMQLLRKKFSHLLSRSKPLAKIYVSRRYSQRSPSFEIELERVLENNGWKILCAERTSLIEQIQSFSNAKLVMGVHGAGLSNAVWMPKKTTLIEIRPPERPHCFARLANVCGINYEYIETSNKVIENRDVPIEILKIL